MLYIAVKPLYIVKPVSQRGFEALDGTFWSKDPEKKGLQSQTQIVKPEFGVAPTFIFLTPFDGFFLVVKLAFFGGIVLSSPLWLLIMFSFISPALEGVHKSFIGLFCALSALFIALGLFFAYKITLPLSMRFFAHFNASLGGTNLWHLPQTVSTILWLYLAHALLFELICLLFLAIHLRLVKPKTLQSARPYVIVATFLAAALLTPPDALSQIALALPTCLLYEIAIFYSKFLIKN